jgi:hypothetical protein
VAQSPAHKLGQIIGDVLESAVEPLLRKFARSHKLYLDCNGLRPARTGKKVSWKDQSGNVHDLDYVLERDGTATRIGVPAAFIETAWRRYTKHSRNKAQEIQGAILPLAATYRAAAPFIGVILAGVFTDGALDQLRSQGFAVLYFPYESVIDAFRKAGVDFSFEEDTAETVLAAKVDTWERLSAVQRAKVAKRLLAVNAPDLQQFMDSLDRCVSRTLSSVRVIPLHGVVVELNSAQDAIGFISAYTESDAALPLCRYEIEILYSNGDNIRAEFHAKETAIEFLAGYAPPALGSPLT